MNKLTVVKNPSTELEINIENSPFCRNGDIYFVPDRENFEAHMNLFSTVKRVNIKLRQRYDNVLKGLNYWKDRALK